MFQSRPAPSFISAIISQIKAFSPYKIIQKLYWKRKVLIYTFKVEAKHITGSVWNTARGTQFGEAHPVQKSFLSSANGLRSLLAPGRTREKQLSDGGKISGMD